MGKELQKAPTWVAGLDELTTGGLPSGRATLVCGGPGCGKTLLATGFLVRGALDQGEPGVLISFDERLEDLDVNSQSLGYDLPELRKRGLLAADVVHLDRDEIEEAGSFDLEGLFIRIDSAVRAVGGRRIVLDTIDTLFAGLPNEAVVRSELRRLLGWLKDRGLTTIITAERGEGTLTRNGIEEYVSDCVIMLDHRVNEQVSTRRLRVVKYRGSAHGTNEYPFFIDSDGFSVLPITSLGLEHQASEERVPTGIAGLDEMLEGKGYFKGSSVLISGGPGAGKTSFAAHFAEAACARREACLYFSFEESPRQLARNMRSIGIDLQKWMDRGLLRCRSLRPTQYGLETHLAIMHREVRNHSPAVVIVDPLSAFVAGDETGQIHVMALRLIDHLKSVGATALFLDLQEHPDFARAHFSISSMMDTWLSVGVLPRDEEDAVRVVRVVKSRGMAHPVSFRAMVITAQGVKVKPTCSIVGSVARGAHDTVREYPA